MREGAIGIALAKENPARLEDQEMWDRFLEKSPIYVFFKDEGNRAVRLSRNYEALAGGPVGGLLGRRMEELFPPGVAECMAAEGLPMSEEGEPVSVEESWDGRTYATIKFPIHRNGGPRHVAGYMIDITDRKRVEERLQESMEQLRRAVVTTIQVLVLAVETKDPYTAGHQRRMANLARAIGTEMGLPTERIEGIRMAGIVHDIGKIALPTEILSKPTRLSDIEFSLIKEHAKQGYEILKDVDSCWPLAEMVLQHHERINSSGYPRRLKGEEIMLEARILAVADVVEAMASHRPYRPAVGLEAALAEIENNSGILYDPEVVEACTELFREKGFMFS